jgi:hypothetical protein
MTERPPVFETVAQALAALKRDKLATVYYRAGQVFVATAYGTGTFAYGRWRREGGQANSQGSDQ